MAPCMSEPVIVADDFPNLAQAHLLSDSLWSLKTHGGFDVIASHPADQPNAAMDLSELGEEQELLPAECIARYLETKEPSGIFEAVVKQQEKSPYLWDFDRATAQNRPYLYKVG